MSAIEAALFRRLQLASGFLTLPDGRCFAQHSTVYDAVLLRVVHALGRDGANGYLREWVREQIPTSADPDYGFGFTRQATDESVQRSIDLRQLTSLNQALFMTALREVVSPGSMSPEHGHEARCFAHLANMVRAHDAHEPPLKCTDLTCINPASTDRIGPGWEE